MNKFFVSLFCAYAIFCFTYAAESKPIPVIFDTDMGNDVDDALALCMLFTAEDMGLCKILCIAHNKDNLNSAVATDIVSKYYGRSLREPEFRATTDGICGKCAKRKNQTVLSSIIDV